MDRFRSPARLVASAERAWQSPAQCPPKLRSDPAVIGSRRFPQSRALLHLVNHRAYPEVGLDILLVEVHRLAVEYR
jgi:hypothetical protein